MERAWAAGFFDGEGCVHIAELKTRYGLRHCLRITVTQRKIEPLTRFTYAVGVEGSMEFKQQGKGCWQLVYAGPKAQAVLRALLPFLSLKKQEAELAIKFQDRMLPKGGNERISAAERAARKLLCDAVRRLKR